MHAVLTYHDLDRVLKQILSTIEKDWDLALQRCSDRLKSTQTFHACNLHQEVTKTRTMEVESLEIIVNLSHGRTSAKYENEATVLVSKVYFLDLPFLLFFFGFPEAAVLAELPERSLCCTI